MRASAFTTARRRSRDGAPSTDSLHQINLGYDAGTTAGGRIRGSATEHLYRIGRLRYEPCPLQKGLPTRWSPSRAGRAESASLSQPRCKGARGHLEFVSTTFRIDVKLIAPQVISKKVISNSYRAGGTDLVP
jgi:hypothetical protein